MKQVGGRYAGSGCVVALREGTQVRSETTSRREKVAKRPNSHCPLRPKHAEVTNLAQPYAPTPHEQAAMDSYVSAMEERPPVPRMKVSENAGIAQISPDHPNPALGQVLLMQALGTTDMDFLDGLLGQLANVGTQGQKLDEHGLNFLLAVVKGVGPKDQVEAMLAAQMAAVHVATMTFARRLAHVETIAQQDSAGTIFNKLARTFAAQVEALKRYQSGGEQKIVVEHVTVNAGGQAIVGNVASDGRAPPEKKGTPP